MNRSLPFLGKLSLLLACMLCALAGRDLAYSQPLSKPQLKAIQANVKTRLEAVQKEDQAAKLNYVRTDAFLLKEEMALRAGKKSPLTGTKVPPNFKAVMKATNLRLARPPLHLSLKGTKLDPTLNPLDATSTKFHDHNFGVRDQGDCGCCWIFGAIAAYEASFMFTGDKDVNAAEQHLLNCVQTFNPDGTPASDGCDGGWPGDALDYLVRGGNGRPAGTGDRSDPKMRYLQARDTCDPNAKLVYTAVEYGYVDDTNQIPDTEAIKAAIFQYGGVAVAICAGDNFKTYQGGADFVTTDFGTINHAVSLIGWKTVGNDTFFLLRNSWGPTWGERGYMWIKAGVSQVGFGAMWVTTSKSGGSNGDKKIDPNCPCPSRPTPPNYNAEVNSRIDYWTKNFPQYAFPK